MVVFLIVKLPRTVTITLLAEGQMTLDALLVIPLSLIILQAPEIMINSFRLRKFSENSLNLSNLLSLLRS